MGHTFTNHLYHIVFSTKERRPWMADAVRQRLLAYIRGIVENLGCHLLAADGAPDHVHLLVKLRPDVAVSKFVATIKANSSRWMSEEIHAVRSFRWQAGYSSFTVSESNWRRVSEYIARQQERHRRLSYPEELAALLRKHGVSFETEHYLD